MHAAYRSNRIQTRTCREQGCESPKIFFSASAFSSALALSTLGLVPWPYFVTKTISAKALVPIRNPGRELLCVK